MLNFERDHMAPDMDGPIRRDPIEGPPVYPMVLRRDKLMAASSTGNSQPVKTQRFLERYRDAP